MKLTGIITGILTAAIIFVSCQKSIVFDPNGPSVGTLKNSLTGDCLPSSVNGIYKKDSTLTSSEYIDVNLDVTTVGAFLVKTDSINGMSFKGSGTFGQKGNNLVRMYGTGKPLAAGTFNFTVTYGANTCTIAVVVLGPNTGIAIYTLAGAGAATGCSGFVLGTGTYNAGQILVAANSATTNVNVTQIGTYIAKTDTVNGISFKASGNFTNVGPQSITLAGSGTPIATGSFNYTLSTGSTSCTFTITVGTGVITPAVYVLGGAPGNCTTPILTGTYQQGLALSGASIKVDVTVNTIGSYTLTTVASNGISFSGSGSFTSTGTQTVTLTGSGTPTSAGIFTNTISGASTTCTFPITFASPPPPASYTLAGAPGLCSPINVVGTYNTGTALNATNTATVQVNVTTIGAYTLTTNTVNGIKFSKTGTFTATGAQSVILAGSGTPIAAATNTFTPQIGASSCTFDVVVVTPTVPTGTYTCKIDGVFTSFADRAHAEILDNTFSPARPYLFLDGYTGGPTGQTVPEFQIFITKNDNSVVGTGTYNELHYLDAYRIEIDYKVLNPDLSTTIWNTSSNLFTPNPPFTIIVTSATSTRIKGTFSGTLTNTLQGSTLTKVITEGVFDLPVQ